jgi:hypothetical protein
MNIGFFKIVNRDKLSESVLMKVFILFFFLNINKNHKVRRYFCLAKLNNLILEKIITSFPI